MVWSMVLNFGRKGSKSSDFRARFFAENEMISTVAVGPMDVRSRAMIPNFRRPSCHYEHIFSRRAALLPCERQ